MSRNHVRRSSHRGRITGHRYRDLWTTPIEVEVLDLSRFAGGLTPLRAGGGHQTKSLRMASGDGRQFTFRSVDKDPSVLLPEPLLGTFVQEIMQDYMSSGHPAGALVAAPLLEATGVLHAEPKLVLMPDGERSTSQRW